jgi:hypothetical protein
MTNDGPQFALFGPDENLLVRLEALKGGSHLVFHSQMGTGLAPVFIGIDERGSEETGFLQLAAHESKNADRNCYYLLEPRKDIKGIRFKDKNGEGILSFEVTDNGLEMQLKNKDGEVNWTSVPETNFIPAGQKASKGKDYSVRLLQMGRMRTVLEAVHLYAYDHNEPPKTLANLRNYLSDPNINADDFIYRRPQNMDAMRKQIVPIVMQWSLDEPNALIVGFSDGHAKYINDSSYIKQLGLDPNRQPATKTQQPAPDPNSSSTDPQSKIQTPKSKTESPNSLPAGQRKNCL